MDCHGGWPAEPAPNRRRACGRLPAGSESGSRWRRHRVRHRRLPGRPRAAGSGPTASVGGDVGERRRGYVSGANVSHIMMAR